MCSLKNFFRNLFLTLISLTLLPLDAQAIRQQISSEVSVVSSSGSVLPTDLIGNSNSRISRNSENISYRIEELGNHFNLAGSVSLSHPDYSNFVLRNSRGQQVSLNVTQPTKIEWAASQSVEWAQGQHFAVITWNGSLNPTPFAFQSFSGSYQISFFEKATFFGLKITTLSQKQPTDFFINREFRNQQRPKQINAFEVVTSYDQVLSERWKAFVDFSLSRRVEERPRNIGITIGNALALSDHFSLKARAARIVELQSEPLLNERGYFNLTSGELSLSYEPIYDLLITISYGLSVEQEQNSDGSAIQLANDQYGIGMKYLYHQYEFQLQGSLSLTNTDFEIFNISGGITWKV